MSNGGHGVIAHPAFQTIAATASFAALLKGNMFVLLAVPGALYYMVLLLKEASTVKQTSVGAVLASLNSMWSRDKPYIAALAIVGMAAATAFGIPIPEWVPMLLGALGLVTVHNISKQTVFSVIQPLTPSLATVVEKVAERDAALNPPNEGKPVP